MTQTADLSPQHYQNVIETVLAEARRAGADAAEAALSIETGLSVTVRLGEVETLEYNHDKGLGITVYLGESKGSASSADLSPQAIADSVRAACDIARHTGDDPCGGLAPKDRMAWDYPDLDLHHPWDIAAEGAIELALACETAARDFDARIVNSEGATVSSHQGLQVYGNSHGFIGAYPSSRHSISCSVIGQQPGQAGMQRDYWYTSARDPAELNSPEQVGRVAAERTIARLGGRCLSTRQAPVLFSAEMAVGLIGHFLRAIRGGALYRKASFLLDSLGTRLFPDWMQMHEQPHLLKALGSAPFDNEGVATRERQLVADGVLQGYVLDSYSACRLGMETTGNAGGVHNLIVSPGEHDRAGLLRQMDTGLLVTELMGQGVNGVTGDYSRGAAGFWVEGGEIQYPVEEITIAGNLRDIYRQILAVGRDVDKQRNIRTGSILVENMTIAGD